MKNQQFENNKELYTQDTRNQLFLCLYFDNMAPFVRQSLNNKYQIMALRDSRL